MELRHCRFYCAEEEMTFAVFSDDACRAKYLESIPLPIPVLRLRVDVYEIEPGAKSQWIAVRQAEGKKNHLKLFVRKGESFLEVETRELSEELKRTILERLPGAQTSGSFGSLKWQDS